MDLNEPDKKKVNDDVVVFMKKRSEHDLPRYTTRMKNYIDFQRKRQRASAARHNSEHRCKEMPTSASGVRKKDEQKDKTENAGWFGKSGDDEKRGRSKSPRSHSEDPSDRCGRVYLSDK